MFTAMRRLDAAYVKAIASASRSTPAQSREAAASLEADIAEATAGSEWT